jgi:hypothetical protein
LSPTGATNGRPRIKADLYLYYFNKTADDATELYMEELAFDRATARGQVLARSCNPATSRPTTTGLSGSLTCRPSTATTTSHTTKSCSRPAGLSSDPRGFLALSEADRKRFLTQFPSMMQSL